MYPHVKRAIVRVTVALKNMSKKYEVKNGKVFHLGWRIRSRFRVRANSTAEVLQNLMHHAEELEFILKEMF